MSEIGLQKKMAEALSKKLGFTVSVVISPSKIVKGKKDFSIFTKAADEVEAVKAEIMKTGRFFFMGTEEVAVLNEVCIIFEMK